MLASGGSAVGFSEVAAPRQWRHDGCNSGIDGDGVLNGIAGRLWRIESSDSVCNATDVKPYVTARGTDADDSGDARAVSALETNAEGDRSQGDKPYLG